MEPEVVETEPLNEVNYMTDEQFLEFMTNEKAEHVELLELDATQHQELLTKMDEINTNLASKLDTLNDSISNIPVVDNADLLGKMDEFITSVNTLTDSLDLFQTASSSVITYAVFLVPLILIVGCGWWFFKQFIK